MPTSLLWFRRDLRLADHPALLAAVDAGPCGRRRDDAVERVLGDVSLVRTRSPYAVTPGRVTKADGSPFTVFSPFARAWRAHGRRAPAPRPDGVRWTTGMPSDDLPPAQEITARLPAAGEGAAHTASARFRDERLSGYHDARNLPATDATSRLSPYLRYGCLHPRTLLADLPAARSEGAESAAVDRFTAEPAWRDFYADVLWHRPETRTGRTTSARVASATTAARRRTSASLPGRMAAPTARSSTPACGSCSGRPGCTTACG